MTALKDFPAFCAAILREIEYVKATGLRRINWFQPRAGLCWNYATWLESQRGASVGKIRSEGNAMRACFVTHGLDRHYPFNGSSSDYCDEVTAGTIWENQHRLAFIRAHANEEMKP